MNETRRAVLAAIAEGPVSGPALAARLDVSRAAVWKHVEDLRADGFEIRSGADGYELRSVEGYTAATIEYGLDAPYAIEYHDSIASTNDRARALAIEGATDVAVVADEQTGGRGRLDREWAAPSGGIWTSVLTRPAVQPARATVFTLAAAVAVARAVREVGVDAHIKWPNDVVVPDGGSEYRKLAGVLTEMEAEPDRVSWLIVGIGVNANVDPDAVPAGATTLRERVGEVDRRAVLRRLLAAFYRRTAQPDDVVSEWRALSATLGRRVRVDRPRGSVVGDAVDVTDAGALVVEPADGDEPVTVTAGDCEHVRPAE